LLLCYLVPGGDTQWTSKGDNSGKSRDPNCLLLTVRDARIYHRLLGTGGSAINRRMHSRMDYLYACLVCYLTGILFIHLTFQRALQQSSQEIAVKALTIFIACICQELYFFRYCLYRMLHAKGQNRQKDWRWWATCSVLSLATILSFLVSTGLSIQAISKSQESQPSISISIFIGLIVSRRSLFIGYN
jgi:hypothetical protein